MVEQSNSQSVVIVGGGITGTAVAHKLSGDHDVTVIDKGMIAGDTTARASGFLGAPEAFPSLPKMGEHCMSFFHEFDGTGVYTFRKSPTVHLVGEDGISRARSYADREQSTGRPVSFKSPDEIHDLYNETFDLSGYGGGLLYENTGYTNPFDLAVSLKHVAEQQGAKFYTDTTVQEVVATDGAVSGVRTRHGVIEADYVVVAAGWRTHDLLTEIVEIPVKPARWESVIVDPVEDLPADYPMGTDWVKYGIYWRPTPEGYLLIGGNPKSVDRKGERELSVSDEFLALVKEQAPEMVRDALDAEVIRDECCPTGAAGTPDTMPIIDSPSDAPEGLIVAAGFQRGGVLASPATATAVRSLITGEEAPFSLDSFAVDRFDDRSADFDLVSYVTRST